MHNNAGTLKPSTHKRHRGGQPGNQNARKHGLHSRLQPADRSAFLRKVLRGYGLEDTVAFAGTPLVALAAESNTHLGLILAMLHQAAQLADLQAQLAGAQDRLHRG